jgi:hypothetical protein
LGTKGGCRGWPDAGGRRCGTWPEKPAMPAGRCPAMGCRVPKATTAAKDRPETEGDEVADEGDEVQGARGGTGVADLGSDET